MQEPPHPHNAEPAELYRLWLRPDAQPLPAPGHQTLLQSVQAAGIELMSSCRNGTCRACIRQLESGRVSYRIEWPGLSAEEKAQGYILPCVAHPQSDLVLKADA
jgi:ferredoxin